MTWTFPSDLKQIEGDISHHAFMDKAECAVGHHEHQGISGCHSIRQHHHKGYHPDLDPDKFGSDHFTSPTYEDVFPSQRRGESDEMYQERIKDTLEEHDLQIPEQWGQNLSAVTIPAVARAYEIDPKSLWTRLKRQEWFPSTKKERSHYDVPILDEKFGSFRETMQAPEWMVDLIHDEAEDLRRKTMSRSKRSKVISKQQPPGPPPRPGLKWKSQTHRWIRPKTEQTDKKKGTEKNPYGIPEHWMESEGFRASDFRFMGEGVDKDLFFNGPDRTKLDYRNATKDWFFTTYDQRIKIPNEEDSFISSKYVALFDKAVEKHVKYLTDRNLIDTNDPFSDFEDDDHDTIQEELERFSQAFGISGEFSVVDGFREGWQEATGVKNFIGLRSALNEILGNETREQEEEFFVQSGVARGGWGEEAASVDQKDFNHNFNKGKENAKGLIAMMIQTRMRLQKQYPSGKVFVYRGMTGGNIYEELKKEISQSEGSIRIPHDGISGYSLSENHSEQFAGMLSDPMDETKGVMLKKEVPIEAILISMSEMGGEVASDFRQESEVLLNSDFTRDFDLSEIRFVSAGNYEN